jgi:acyl carrier protein
VAPTNPLEEFIAEIWKELLGVERVGTEDHFFDLGGHSLQGVRLMSRIAEVFGIRLPVRKIFEAPRLRELAIVVAEEMLREAEELEAGQPA